jgi:hypothetical protein
VHGRQINKLKFQCSTFSFVLPVHTGTNWIQTYSVMLEVNDNMFVSCFSIDIIVCKDLKKYLQIINKKSSVFNSEKNNNK